MAKLTKEGIINLYRGDTEDLILTWFEEDVSGASTPFDLSVFTRIDFQVKPAPNAEENFIDRSTEDSTITVSGDDDNVLTILLPPSVTELLNQTKNGWYADLQMTESDGTVTSYPKDGYWRVPVNADVTRV